MYRISFKKEDRHYFNYQGILKQENQSNWDILDLLKAPAKSNNLLDIKFETVTVKWRIDFSTVASEYLPKVLLPSFQLTIKTS